MTELPPATERLRAHLHTTRLMGSIHSSLYYDQNTVMPRAAAPWRGEQLALLARMLHERQSSAAYADLVAEAEAELGPGASGEAQRNLALLRQDLQRQQRLDPELVGQIAEAQARGYACWQEARARADFGHFAPALRTMVALRQEQARQLDEPRSCWETLAQPFEPEISKARLVELFAPLRQRLPVLLEQVRAEGRPELPAWDLPEAAQERLCRQLLDAWGYDPERCQRARSPHPFSCTLGPEDFRITTRVVPGQPLSAFLATAHEWGHSLYEQGLPRRGDHWFPWPLGEATSMGVHESQSLFWECRVARSEAGAARWYPRFREALEAVPDAVPAGRSARDFWHHLNPMRPGLIRVEADELSYGLHIVLRFELELALLEEGMPVEELPQQWNSRMVDLLGIRPGNDAEGCLQDVHWSEGLFGYFPSYALGHLISAQLAQAMERDLGPIEELVASGQEGALRDWLGRHVHRLGRSVNAEELVAAVSGRPLQADAFLAYLEAKLERLRH